MKETQDWQNYIQVMTQVLELELDPTRQQALREQLATIEQIAAPLMALELDPRLEVAGVWRL